MTEQPRAFSTKRFSISDLRNAAAVVKESGVVIDIETPNGTHYRIRPEVAETPLGTTQREIDDCDKAFGL